MGNAMQAIAAIFFWMRLTKCLFLFPKSGMTLLMVLRMTQDLKHFLTLLVFFILATGAALHVWLSSFLVPTETHLESSAGFMTTVLSVWSNVVMNGEPASLMGDDDPLGK